MRKIILILAGVLGIFFLGCQQSAETTKSSTKIQQQDSLDFAFQSNIKYAKGFQVIHHGNYKEIFVFNPLNDDTLAKYITTLSGTKLPDKVKNKGQVIDVPLKSIACLSTTHVSALSTLDLREKLVGCSSPEYIWDEALQERIKNGKVKEIARGMGLNIEQIIALSPDALMQSFMDKTDVDSKLSRSGINILYNNEWKEPNLLGRAEWIKFMALFFGKEYQADSIFRAVETHYLNIKNKASEAQTKPSVMYGSDYKGTWYIPQSKTYVAQIFNDANAHFTSAGEGNSSAPQNFETVYQQYHDADYWFCPLVSIQTLKDFYTSNERYADFKSAQNGKVYANNKREKPNGGNDYWESGVNRPDLLLKDVVHILHPELYPDYQTTYWQHLK